MADQRDENAVIEYAKVVEQFGDEFAGTMITSFEQTTFQERMPELLQGMLEKDWLKAMGAAHAMKGSAGYICAWRFVKVCNDFQTHIKSETIKVENPNMDLSNYKAQIQNQSSQYLLKTTFDDTKKIQAYEMFLLIVPEALSLKKEMAKYSNSEVPADLYVNETKLIKRHFEEFQNFSKKGSKINQSMHMISQKSLNSKQNIEIAEPVVIDPPQDTKCCQKCAIF